MPKNPETGKTDRRPLSPTDLLEFRLKQTEKTHSKSKKGKKRAVDPPEAAEPEGSGQVPSPLQPLATLKSLTLDSGGSSATNTPADTPADSPTTVPQLPLPDRPAPRPLAPKTLKAATPSIGKF